MRIAPTAFATLDMDALEELAGLYNTKNHKTAFSTCPTKVSPWWRTLHTWGYPSRRN